MNEQHQQMLNAIQKIGDRLVETRFAERFILDRVNNFGRFIWTDDGIILRDFVQRIYGIPGIHPKEILPFEQIALIALLISSHEIEKPNK
jgi:hypothetical protein